MNLNLSDDDWKTNKESGGLEQETFRYERREYDDLQNDDWMKQFGEEPYVAKVEPPKKKSFKEVVSIVFMLLMVVGISAWCLISGVKGLFLAPVHAMEESFTNLVKGDVYEGTITYITPEVGELKHTVNFISVGTEHYYFMFSEDGTKVIPIRVPKAWDEQYTDAAVMEVSLQERGIVRELDYQVRSELMSSLSGDLEMAGINVERMLYIDLNTNKLCILQIITGLSLIICSAYLALAVKRSGGNKENLKSPIITFVTILLIVTMGILVYLLNMI